MITLILSTFFVAGAQCQLLMAKTESTMWANLILKRHDAVLVKVKDNISESFTDLRNSPLSGSSELFHKDAVEKAIVKAGCDLHDEAIRRVVTVEQLSKKHLKHLQLF